MQCCSLQLQTLLSPPNTSTIEHHFSFGPVTSFFLELLVIAFHSSPVAHWTPSDLAGSSSSVISFFLIILFMGSCCENTGVVAIPSSSGPRFVRTLHYDPSVLLKILQASLQQYVNQELPDVLAGFRKRREARDQIANICWIIEK